ncbi:hypothetical protein P7E02_11560 [Enterococcus hulanensis]|uniref:hypothetical protein n=1 Tax=Enterococcus hulanensis TaxID=2559929 RepID=UPI00288E44F9|nr:hypothetical protein [Enterococcus hulanensis]MDT2660509.1 hypothetical protein [Enterococcus hulanensis]
MKQDFWVELEMVIKDSKLGEEFADKAIQKLLPYIKTCVGNYYRKALSYGVMIPFEDFYSNSLLSVWEGLQAIKSNTELNIKNVILYRLNISEKKTWRQYRKKGASTDSQQISYSSARWADLDFDCTDSHDLEHDVLSISHFDSCIKQFSMINQEYAEIIKLLITGYSSKEAFQKVYNISNYSSKERKKMERIKKRFKQVYNN